MATITHSITVACVGRKQERDGRERFNLLPNNRRGKDRHVYAVGFADGRTKIGISCHPRARVCAHWVASDGGIVWAHVFGRIGRKDAEHIERAALDFASKLSSRIGRTEMFRDLSRDDALACVRRAAAEFSAWSDTWCRIRSAPATKASAGS